jgi:hypothetical protein
MDSKAKLIKTATRYAEDSFDKQMLDLIETIKGNKKLHSQHRTMLIEYNEAHRRRLLKEEIGICT